MLGSAEPGSSAFDMAAAAGELIAKLGYTLVSGCGSPATRVAAERAIAAGGQVLSIVPQGEFPPTNPPDERKNSPILASSNVIELESRLLALTLSSR